jgi:hypothetical protein
VGKNQKSEPGQKGDEKDHKSRVHMEEALKPDESNEEEYEKGKKIVEPGCDQGGKSLGHRHPAQFI